ncbi:MAG TPA: hypothetical protein VER76_02785 [Pyrinomonadaceae bacterium]|nr:hypothetical protein [Pyrinomonadaceae bacterium]
MRRIEPVAKRWRWGVAAATALAFVALVPQLLMWSERGRAWQGTHLSFYSDESSYAAYLNALIDGRPRLNDPYTGKDDAPGAPLAESPYTTQFVPAYALALPARLLGLDSNAVFIALSPLAAFASTLALFRLLRELLTDARLAATCALVVLCGVSLAQKIWLTLLGRDAAYLFLPFLRRYAPAASFALFFVFCALVMRALAPDNIRALTPDKKRAPLAYAALAGTTFALLVYSYFYLWTTAAAWLAALALIWLAAARAADDRRRALAALSVVAAFALAALVPYFALLARRAPTVDTAQALVRWRAPDLFRTSELTAALALSVIAFGAWRGFFNWRDRATLCAASFALTPFVVFNQQIITGRVLQPIHYEQFTANYLSVLALVLSIVLCWRGRAAANGVELKIPKFVLPLVALAALGWGMAEALVVARRYLPVNVVVDEARPAARRLEELARVARSEGRAPQAETVFCPDILQADRLPEVVPQSVLWAPHTFVFSGSAPGEEKQRLYQQLYYSNVDEQKFAAFISRPHPFRTAVFGWGRVINGLDITRTPITDAELDGERRAYADYVNTFSRERAARTPLAYVLLAANADASTHALGNLDRWYARDTGERVGNYVIYRVKLRP